MININNVKCVSTISESGIDLSYTGLEIGEWYIIYDYRKLDKRAGGYPQYRIETKSGGYWIYCYLFETIEKHRENMIDEILSK